MEENPYLVYEGSIVKIKTENNAIFSEDDSRGHLPIVGRVEGAYSNAIRLSSYAIKYNNELIEEVIEKVEKLERGEELAAFETVGRSLTLERRVICSVERVKE